jgi:hypothetical protein
MDLCLPDLKGGNFKRVEDSIDNFLGGIKENRQGKHNVFAIVILNSRHDYSTIKKILTGRDILSQCIVR